MKTILVGYKDAAGITAPVVISGIEVSAYDQSKILDAARIRHEFPEGILRLEQRNADEVLSLAQFINESVKEHLQKSDDARKAEQAKAKAEAQAAQAKTNAITEARKVVQKYANLRNSAIADLAAHKDAIRGGRANEKTSQTKLDQLQETANNAAALFEKLRSALEVAQSAKSDAAAVLAALATLKNPEAK